MNKLISKKSLYLLGSLVGTLSPLGTAWAQYNFRQTFSGAFQNNRIYRAGDLIGLMESIAGFLIIAGGILAGIAIITSGILYMTAGSNTTRTGMAKSWFKNGIIGALILFAAGTILYTILLIALDPFSFFT